MDKIDIQLLLLGSGRLLGLILVEVTVYLSYPSESDDSASCPEADTTSSPSATNEEATAIRSSSEEWGRSRTSTGRAACDARRASRQGASSSSNSKHATGRPRCVVALSSAW